MKKAKNDSIGLTPVVEQKDLIYDAEISGFVPPTSADTSNVPPTSTPRRTKKQWYLATVIKIIKNHGIYTKYNDLITTFQSVKTALIL